MPSLCDIVGVGWADGCALGGWRQPQTNVETQRNLMPSRYSNQKEIQESEVKLSLVSYLSLILGDTGGVPRWETVRGWVGRPQAQQRMRIRRDTINQVLSRSGGFHELRLHPELQESVRKRRFGLLKRGVVVQPSTVNSPSHPPTELASEDEDPSLTTFLQKSCLQPILVGSDDEEISKGAPLPDVSTSVPVAAGFEFLYASSV
eukprot:1127048-Amphidinium_carterae.1